MHWRDLPLTPHQRAECLVRAASWLVPSHSRGEWRREWASELHYAARDLKDRGAAESAVVEFAWGAFPDAAWHRMRAWNPDTIERAVSRGAQSPTFCLAALSAVLLMVVVFSGFLPETRAVLFPLPYAAPDRIATVAQGGSTLAMRAGVRGDWVQWWRSDSKLIEDAATYVWKEQTIDGAATRRAWVSANFFPLLGARFEDGKSIVRGCMDCAFLSYDFWRKNYQNVPAYVEIDGRNVRVGGVLDRRFWFLTRRVGVWVISEENPKIRTGVVLRLKKDVTSAQAETELETVLQRHFVNAWSSLIEVSPLTRRVRSVFGSFALALLLAIGTILPALRSKLGASNFITWRVTFARVAFFGAKTALLLLVILFLGLEFTPAASITMLGGTDLSTEPLSTWLFLLGSMGALSWSIYDQRRRCRVCLWRYAVAAQIGCSGCILLGWSGTELVCLEGHGTLHVPERVASWQEQERWTSLDDSVLELFANN